MVRRREPGSALAVSGAPSRTMCQNVSGADRRVEAALVDASPQWLTAMTATYDLPSNSLTAAFDASVRHCRRSSGSTVARLVFDSRISTIG
jgi:hypothetical protein